VYSNDMKRYKQFLAG